LYYTNSMAIKMYLLRTGLDLVPQYQEMYGLCPGCDRACVEDMKLEL
jgi:hypothetical protein